MKYAVLFNFVQGTRIFSRRGVLSCRSVRESSLVQGCMVDTRSDRERSRRQPRGRTVSGACPTRQLICESSTAGRAVPSSGAIGCSREFAIGRANLRDALARQRTVKHRYGIERRRVIGRVLSANIKKSGTNDYSDVRTSALDYINCRSIYGLASAAWVRRLIT